MINKGLCPAVSFDRYETEPQGGESGKGNLVQLVYERIREMMFNYEILPGQRLVFNDLAQRLQVSRTPVNNALGILASEGFLDFVPNQGYRVHQITREEAESLYEIREMLEVGAAARIVCKIDEQKLAAVGRQMALYNEAISQKVSRGRFMLDQEYHASYLSITKNIYLAHYFREVYQRIYLRHRIEGMREERTQMVVKEHRRIIEALMYRDTDGFKDAIRDHIRAGKEYIFSIVFSE